MAVFDVQKCGTRLGRDQHRRHGLAPCEPCRQAWNAVSRERQAKLRASGWVRPSRTAGKPRVARVDGHCTRCGKTIKTSATEPMCRACRYRAKRGIAITAADRLAIYDRDGWTCGICLEAVDRKLTGHDQWGPTLDHIHPRSLGGSDDPENLRLAHRACNSARGAQAA